MSLVSIPSGDNRESIHERQPVDLASKTATMKPASESGRLSAPAPQSTGQIRGVATGVGHAQTRVLSSAIQTISSVPLCVGTAGTQATLKQVSVSRTGIAAASTASSPVTLPQVTRPVLSGHTTASHMSTTYHVPRGAAAVANIAAPRSAVATPIVRATAGATSATHGSSFVSGLRALGPNSLTPRVSSPATSTTWMSGTAAQASSGGSPRPRASSITTIPAYTQGRPTSMTVTARPITPQVSQSQRPQLLHTSAHKSIASGQLHISENNYFKQGVSVQSGLTGVSIARTQAPLTYSTSASPAGATQFSAPVCGQPTATLIATQSHQITLSQGLSGQARLAASNQGAVLTATTTPRPGQSTPATPPARAASSASPARLTSSTTPSGQATAVLTGSTRLTVAAPPRLVASTASASGVVGQLGTTVPTNHTRILTSGSSTVPGQGTGQSATPARLTVSSASSSTTVLPAQSARIAVPNTALASAGVVSLHPVVVSNTSSNISLKTTGHTPLVTSASRNINAHQTLGPKVIAQPVHGPPIQITQVPVSSVAGKVQSAALTITTGTARPVPYTATTTVTGTTMSSLQPVTVATSSTIPVAKVFPQAAPVSDVTQAASVYIQTSHRASPAPSSNQVSVERASSMLPTYSLPTYYYEQPSTNYQVTSIPGVSGSLVARPYTPTSPYAVHTTTTTSAAPVLRTGVHGIVTSGQPVRFNPVVVVDPSRSAMPVHSSYLTEGTLVQSETSVVGQSSQLQPVSKPNASPRPSILRKRDNEGSPLKAQKNLTPVLASLAAAPLSPPSPRRPDSRGNGGNSSGGSTTISATSSPGLGEAGEDSLPPIKQEPVEEAEKPPVEMSPRKKPRKQQLTGNELHEPKFSEDEMEFISEEKIKKEAKEVNTGAVLCTVPEECEETVYLPKRPNISLINSYRYSWKSRHNHYLRYSDVKPKDERRPTVSDLANQKQVLQKLNGWKIHHLSTQMEDLAELETQVFEKLTTMLKLMEKRTGKDVDKDVNRVNELIKGNMQRSKVIKDQMEEAKCQVMKIFDHKCHVTDIISRCANKRSLKKRDKS